MSGTGWPFVIGSGRRRDYSTLLAPDFLVAAAEHGILDERVSPLPDGAAPRTVVVTTAGGVQLGITYATHRVTATDLALDVAGSSAAEPRDEHSRPLLLSYGIICQDARITGPAEADLAAALRAALSAYRAFLTGEEQFQPIPSSAFRLTSPTTPTRAGAMRTRVERAGAVPAGSTRADAEPGVSAPAELSGRRRAAILAAVGAAVTVIAVLLMVLITGGLTSGPHPCASPTSTRPDTSTSCAATATP